MNAERPVEELGWRFFDSPIFKWHRPTCAVAELAEGCSATTMVRALQRCECTRAEVDDLAAWLDRHLDAPVNLDVRRHDDEWLVDVWPGGWRVHGPTIRDALIAAVRKVAAQ